MIVGSDTQIQYYEQSNSKDLIGIISNSHFETILRCFSDLEIR
ncbi:hypothetical protein MICAG_2330003 [Microcystis aeruginosa PCC 9808]|uniref:Uncharacterized protein n=1 Tax=Microcystis aeruginosa PCC 9808 TaxID=1160284 RepID=I4HPP4_MICAE|nr:hypothetical protein MICAG_2330003 [Microcystis aeruginosa PCC 9808]